MNLLPEEIGLVREKDLGPFNLPQIKDQGWNLLRRRASSIGEALEEVAEGGRLIYYVF